MTPPGRFASNDTSSFVTTVVVSEGGGGVPVIVPKQLRSVPCAASQKLHDVAGFTQPAVHSQTLPAMSCAPHVDTHALRSPVSAAKSEFVAHVVAPSSAAS